MLQDRVGAIIIQDRKLLLVTGYDESFYWTPGGKIEDGESHEACLKRELFAELDIELKSMRHYDSCILPSITMKCDQQNYYYLVEYTGNMKPKAEITKTVWYSKEDFLKNAVELSNGVKHLMPMLIKDGYV